MPNSQQYQCREDSKKRSVGRAARNGKVCARKFKFVWNASTSDVCVGRRMDQPIHLQSLLQTTSQYFQLRAKSFTYFIEGRSLGTHFVDLRHRSMINFLEGNTWLKLFVLVTKLLASIPKVFTEPFIKRNIPLRHPAKYKFEKGLSLTIRFYIFCIRYHFSFQHNFLVLFSIQNRYVY